MKKLIALLFIIILTTPVFAELHGEWGLYTIKNENGAFMYSPTVKLKYPVNKQFSLDGLLSENFTTDGYIGFPEHHSWRYVLGIEYQPFEHWVFQAGIDNRSLILGHENVFIDEFSYNRNYLNIFYNF